MARKLDPKIFPPTPGSFLKLSLIPEFGQLISVMVNFSALVAQETVEAMTSGKPLVPSSALELWVGAWLAYGLNEDVGGLDTATFTAATLIRDHYQPPVLEKTAASLKPNIVQLMSQIDNWMADGIRLIFSGRVRPYDASALAAWTMQQGILIRELKRIWTASGSGPHNAITPPRAAGRSDEQLKSAFESVPPGKESALEYEKLILDSLTTIFDPELSNPKSQQRVDGGRMRIDITFDNNSREGFFLIVREMHRKKCPYIFFECKNYSAELGNPEFAQLEDRMHAMRCQVGFVVFRSAGDEQAILKQCKERSGTADDRPFVLALDDKDILNLLALRRDQGPLGVTEYLNEKLRHLLFKA
jgi:hypothetical protein